MHTADSFSRQPDRKEFLLCISTKICRPVLYCYDDAMYRSVACYNNAAVFVDWTRRGNLGTFDRVNAHFRHASSVHAQA